MRPPRSYRYSTEDQLRHRVPEAGSVTSGGGSVRDTILPVNTLEPAQEVEEEEDEEEIIYEDHANVHLDDDVGSNVAGVYVVGHGQPNAAPFIVPPGNFNPVPTESATAPEQRVTGNTADSGQTQQQLTATPAPRQNVDAAAAAAGATVTTSAAAGPYTATLIIAQPTVNAPAANAATQEQTGTATYQGSFTVPANPKAAASSEPVVHSHGFL